MAPHPSTLAWKIPWMEEPGRLQSMGSLGSDTTEWLHFHFSLSCIGEGNGNPLQCSCLENPRDGGAWWAAIYGSHRVGHDWSDLVAVAVAICQEDLWREGMTTHSSILAWRIPWTGKPGGLQSMGSQRVRHNWAMFAFYTLEPKCQCPNVRLAKSFLTLIQVHMLATCLQSSCSDTSWEVLTCIFHIVS